MPLQPSPRALYNYYKRLIRFDQGTVLKYGDSYGIQRESDAIKFIKCHTNIPVPSVLETQISKRDGSLIIEFLPGERLDLAWPFISPKAKEVTRIQLKAFFDELRALP